MAEKQRVERVAAAGRPLRKRWRQAAVALGLWVETVIGETVLRDGILMELNGVPVFRAPVPREAPASEVEGVVTNMTTHRPALAAPS